MKKLLETSFLVLVLATVAAVAGVIFLFVALAFVANMIGGTAIWVLLFSWLFGVQLSLGEIYGIATLTLVIIFAIYCYKPEAIQVFEPVVSLVCSLVCGLLMIVMLVVAFGVPGWFLLVLFYSGKTPAWWMLPIGVATIIATVMIERAAKKIKTQKSTKTLGGAQRIPRRQSHGG